MKQLRLQLLQWLTALTSRSLRKGSRPRTSLRLCANMDATRCKGFSLALRCPVKRSKNSLKRTWHCWPGQSCSQGLRAKSFVVDEVRATTDFTNGLLCSSVRYTLPAQIFVLDRLTQLPVNHLICDHPPRCAPHQ